MTEIVLTLVWLALFIAAILRPSVHEALKQDLADLSQGERDQLFPRRRW